MKLGKDKTISDFLILIYTQKNLGVRRVNISDLLEILGKITVTRYSDT